jgi:hypothetical protein
MNRLLTMVALSLVVALLSAAHLDAQATGPGPGPGPDPDSPAGPQARECSVPTLLWQLPYENLRSKEIKHLLYIREEEKLARDVYMSLYESWGVRLFKKTARQESNHLAWTKVLIDKYELIDPIAGNGIGVFDDPDLQRLYTDLVVVGNESVVDALTVGAALEELNLYDLITKALRRANNEDLRALYENLMKSSRNHLRTFVTRLERYGVVYENSYLSDETYAGIVNTPAEKGLMDASGEWVCGGWK